MNNYLKPPTLSTGFSESGKSAKKRFANIFDRTNKKRGVWALVLPGPEVQNQLQKKVYGFV